MQKKTLSVDYSYWEVQSENDTSLESAPSNFRWLDNHRLCTIIELEKLSFSKTELPRSVDFRKRLQSHTACQWRRTSLRKKISFEELFFTLSWEFHENLRQIKIQDKKSNAVGEKSSLSKLKSFSPLVVSKWRRRQTHNHRHRHHRASLFLIFHLARRHSLRKLGSKAFLKIIQIAWMFISS